MQILHESAVAAEEIDHLGHMNVRFYMERAQRGNRVLLERVGWGREALAGARWLQNDTYTRYQREQFRGSTLRVKGGVLKASREGLSTYFEVVNDDKGQVAAPRSS